MFICSRVPAQAHEQNFSFEVLAVFEPDVLAAERKIKPHIGPLGLDELIEIQSGS